MHQSIDVMIICADLRQPWTLLYSNWADIYSYVYSDIIVECCSLPMVEAKLTILDSFLYC